MNINPGRRSVGLAVVLLLMMFPANRASAQTSEATVIEPGVGIERQIQANESHDFRVRLRTGEFFHTDVEQIGADVSIRAIAPDGSTFTEADSPTETRSSETVSLVAVSDGEWRLVVSCSGTEASGGRYRISPAVVREATSTDRARVAAEIAQNEGLPLFMDSTPEAHSAALTKYEAALARWREVGDRAWTAATLSAIGSLRLELQRFDRAAAAFREEIPLRRSINDAEGEALALDNLGVVLGFLGNRHDALVYHERARARARSAGLQVREASALGHIASLWSTRGQNVKAFELFGQALPVLEADGDPIIYPAALAEYANVALAIGERDVAAAAYAKLLPIAEANGLPKLVSAAYLGQGNVLADRGESEKALVVYRQSLTSSDDIGDFIGVARAHNAMGNAYDQLGDIPEAISHYTVALELLAKSPSTLRDQGATLNNLGLTYLTLTAFTGVASRANDERALRCFKGALSRWSATGDRFYQSAALVNMSRAEISLGRPRRALAPLAEALALSRSLDYSSGEAAALKVQGDAFRALRDWTRSLAAYDAALPIARNRWFAGSEATVLLGMARTERARNNLVVAQKRIEDALAVVESARSRLRSRELRTTFFAEAQIYYDFYIDLLMQRHDLSPSEGWNAQALEVSERARARNLVELLANAETDIRSDADPELSRRISRLRDELDAKADAQLRSTNTATDEEKQSLATDVERLSSELRAAIEAARAADPRYAETVAPTMATLATIQKDVLDGETTLVEFWFGENRSYAWVVSPTSIKSVKLARRADIDDASRELYEILSSLPGSTSSGRGLRLPGSAGGSKPARSPALDAGSRLARMVYEPVDRAGLTERVLVVADGALQFIPLAALPGPPSGNGTREPLLVTHEFVYAPSASAVAVMRKQTAGRTHPGKIAAVFADPVFDTTDPRLSEARAAEGGSAVDGTADRGLSLASVKQAARDTRDTPGETLIPRLSATAGESDALKRILGQSEGRYLLGFDATRTAVESPDLVQFRYVHFATHGFLNTRNPELSGLVLSLYDSKGQSTPGFLLINDVFNLRLGADLVVLSACETALGKQVRGEGLQGVTQGFFHAGTPRVIASLWKVDDRATGELMTEMYEHMVTDGERPAAALRKAQLSVWSDVKWRAPYFWAAFVAEGEWR